jgi:predicted ferric reductase
MGLKQFVLCWLAIGMLVGIGSGTVENGIILTGPVYGYLMLLAVFGAPVAAYLLVTRRDVDVRRLWLFVGVVYVLGLGPYALFQAYPLLSSDIVGLVLRAIALVGILAVGYYLVYERRVGERVTA